MLSSEDDPEARLCRVRGFEVCGGKSFSRICRLLADFATLYSRTVPVNSPLNGSLLTPWSPYRSPLAIPPAHRSHFCLIHRLFPGQITDYSFSMCRSDDMHANYWGVPVLVLHSGPR